MSQESVGGLAWLSIKNEEAKNFDFRKVIRQFASAGVGNLLNAVCHF